MLRGLQPLRLLGNATVTPKGPSRPPAFDYEEDEGEHNHTKNQNADGQDDTNSTDDEAPVFSSPQDHDEAVAGAAPTPSKESDQPSTPIVVPMVDPVPKTPRQTPPRSHDKDQESGPSPTPAEPSATDQLTTEKQAMSSQANTITPCLKGKGPPNNTNKKKAKRLSPAEQTHQSSLHMAEKLLHCTEATCKTLNDECKRVQKVVKRLQQQLQEAQGLQQQYQTQLEEAMKNKKEAVKEYKTLTRLWEKYEASEQKKELARKEELTVLKEAMKRKAVDDETDLALPPHIKRNKNDPPTNKHNKTKTSKRPKQDNEGESSNSESDQAKSSEDEDSDWEGARRAPKTTSTATPPNNLVDTTKRTSGRKTVARSKEWSCPTCTLLNAADLEECDACGTPK